VTAVALALLAAVAPFQESKAVNSAPAAAPAQADKAAGPRKLETATFALG
jgi:hypothetical protein